MAIDDRSLLPSEVVSLSPPADASSSRWRRFKNWGASQWAHEDADLTTTTAPGGSIAGELLSVWSEGRIPWRSDDRGYNGVFLGWNRAKDAPPQLTLWRCLRGRPQFGT